MTYKIPDCPQCRNQGFYLRYVPMEMSFRLPCPEVAIPEPLPVEQVDCDCEHGRIRRIHLDQMKHPEYENPFAAMSDREIIEAMERETEREKLIEEEFNL